MATYVELQTRIERLVIDLPTAVQSEVPTLINEALRDLQTDHNFKVMEAILEAVQTTVDTRVLRAVPSDFKEYRGDPYFIEELGTFRPMVVAAVRTAALTQWNTDDDGEPRVLVEAEASDVAGTRNWEVYPLPDGNSDYDNGEYRIYIPYWKYLPDLNADDDTNWFTVHGEKYIIEAATAAAFELDWDAAHQAEHLQLADIHKKRLIKRDKMLRLSPAATLVPLYQGENWPHLRRL